MIFARWRKRRRLLAEARRLEEEAKLALRTTEQIGCSIREHLGHGDQMGALLEGMALALECMVPEPLRREMNEVMAQDLRSRAKALRAEAAGR